MSNDIRTAVAAYLADKGVTYSAQHLGERVKRDGGKDAKPWKCDAWLCVFVRGAVGREFDFFTGTGLREQVKHMPSPPYRRNTLAYEEWEKKAFRAKAPDAADVLHSIVLDASACEQSFADWCHEYDYDEDSRKALAIYETCQQNTDNLVQLFGTGAVLSDLADILQDY